MKILLPFQDPYNHALTHPIVSGGTEMFCKSIYDNFNTTVHQVPYESIDYSMKDKKKISQDIINHAENIGADVIISNFAQAIYCGSEIIKSHIPIMIVEHCIYPMASCITRWNNAIDNGHSVFWVSKWQEKKYKKMAERTNQRVVPITGYVNPSYCKQKPQINETEYDCGTIGRCDSGKNPFKLKHMTKGRDVSSLVITSSTQLKKDIPYYNKNKDWDDVVWNEPYDKVIDNIAKCNTYFSTWNGETWGINAMEALSCGVPVILNCDNDGDHASEIIPAHKGHYKMIPNNDKDALYDAIKSFDVDRKEVQEMTWEKHSIDGWKLQFADAVNRTIDKFNRPSLSSFMS
jgi:glycosyltransferase involved in cell wall biosynthesis